MFCAHSPQGGKGDKTDDWHKLSDHLNGAAKLAAGFASFFADGKELARMAGLLHDLGKYTPAFQKKLQGAKCHAPHSAHGAKQAIASYGDLGYLLAYAIAGHHAGLANGTGFDSKRQALDQRLANCNLSELADAWHDEIKLTDKDVMYKALDKFKRDKANSQFQCAFLIRMLFSCLVNADRQDTKAYYDNSKEEQCTQQPSLKDLHAKLEQHLQSFQSDKPNNEINTWRSRILTSVTDNASLEQGIFSLTVPTGGGKTLTSLAFALKHAIKHNLRRVIYVIPYTNIIEQTADVFRQALGNEAILEHHSDFNLDNLKSDDHYQGEEKFKLATETWNAPLIITTAVQFFESLFAAKTTKCCKLHNISSSVVVLDEVQTTPLPVLFPCMVALQELARNYRTSIVLCTATQPALGADKIKHGFENVRELAPEQDKMFKLFKRVNVQNKVEKWSDDELLEQIKAKSQVLCIVNNRKHALFLASKLQANRTTGVRLLTTYMCSTHRRKVLEVVRQDLIDNKDCRLVATSLVEAGVDLDFACVLRAVAGLDSIAQAAGRCNREGKRTAEESNVIIFDNTNSEWKPPLELKQFAQEANEVLRSGVDPLSKEAITSYFSNLYWTKGNEQLDAKGILKTLQKSKLKSLPFEQIDNDFTMIEDKQHQIIIPYDEKARDLIKRLGNEERCSSVARKLQAYCISIPQSVYEKILKEGKLITIAEEKFADQFVQLNDLSLYGKDFGFDCSDR